MMNAGASLVSTPREA